MKITKPGDTEVNVSTAQEHSITLHTAELLLLITDTLLLFKDQGGHKDIDPYCISVLINDDGVEIKLDDSAGENEQ